MRNARIGSRSARGLKCSPNRRVASVGPLVIGETAQLKYYSPLKLLLLQFLQHIHKQRAYTVTAEGDPLPNDDDAAEVSICIPCLLRWLRMGSALSKLSLEDRTQKAWNRCCFAWNRWLHPILHYGAVPAIFALGLAANSELTVNPITLFQKLIIN